MPGPVLDTGVVIKEVKQLEKEGNHVCRRERRSAENRVATLAAGTVGVRGGFMRQLEIDLSVTPVLSFPAMPPHQRTTNRTNPMRNRITVAVSQSTNKFLVSICGSASCSRCTAGHERTLSQGLCSDKFLELLK